MLTLGRKEGKSIGESCFNADYVIFERYACILQCMSLPFFSVAALVDCWNPHFPTVHALAFFHGDRLLCLRSVLKLSVLGSALLPPLSHSLSVSHRIKWITHSPPHPTLSDALYSSSPALSATCASTETVHSSNPTSTFEPLPHRVISIVSSFHSEQQQCLLKLLLFPAR